MAEPRRNWTTLGLPLVDVRNAWIAVLVNLVLYAATLQRDLGFFDSSELAMVGETLGLGHPTGQPLHTLATFLVTRIPGVPSHLAAAALSALVAALTIVPATSLAERWGRPSPWIPLVLTLVAQHVVVWESATRVEVYALAAFLMLWATAYCASLDGAPRKAWLGVGVVVGFVESTHPYLGVIAAAALAPAVLEATRTRGLGVLGAVVGGGFVGLLPFLYVPFAASRHPEVFVWGGLADAAAYRHYFTAADYARNQGVSGSDVLSHFASLLAWGTTRGGIVPLALAGSALVAWRARGGIRAVAAIAWVLSLLAIAINVIFDPEIADTFGYLAPAWWLSGVGLAMGATELAKTERLGDRGRVYAGALVLVLFLGLALGRPAPWQRTRIVDDLARAMVYGVLEEAPPDAILVVESDYWVGPLLYATEVERRRPDVLVIPWPMAGASWWWEHQQAVQPMRPFALRGEGGVRGRLQRLAAAHPERPVLVEPKDDLIRRVGRPVCSVGWAAHTGTECRRLDPRVAIRALRERHDAIGEGSPPVPGVVAAVTADLGVVLWRLGRAREALLAFEAGVPDEERLAVGNTLAASPLAGPGWTQWERHVPYGEKARNHFLASELLRAAAEPEMAAQARALAGDLPEAQR